MKDIVFSNRQQKTNTKHEPSINIHIHIEKSFNQNDHFKEENYIDPEKFSFKTTHLRGNRD